MVATTLFLAVALCAGGALAAAVGDADPWALPKGLLIGAGVSAIQTEGAWNVSGKGESAADHVMHVGHLESLGFPSDTTLHDVAADSYHRYREDVKAAADLGLTMYRLSISWSRVLPDAATRNEEGIAYYHSLIDEILKYKMTPMVTLYHFDHPWILEEQFHGWQDEKMVEYFKTYAQLVFKEYGGKVKLWITINEPNMYCTYFPSLFLTAGLYKPSDMDHYACIRNTILAHAEAYHVFKDAGYDGRVGFSAILMTARPNTTLPEDVYAADAFNQMHAGIVLSPVIHGDWPELVKSALGDKLTPFSAAEQQRIKGTSDFFGVNIYYSMVASYTTADMSFFAHIPVIGPFLQDIPFVMVMVNGLDFAHMTEMYSLIEPDAMRTSLLWAWDEYKLPLVITENGYGDMKNLGKKDRLRGVYHSAFLRSLVSTVNDYSVDVLGYCTWSLIDSFEWSAGYGRPFGLVHIDYEGGTLDRSFKDSSQFWIELAKTGSIPVWEDTPTTPAAPPTTPAAPPTTAATPSSSSPKPSSAAAATPAAVLLLVALTAAIRS